MTFTGQSLFFMFMYSLIAEYGHSRSTAHPSVQRSVLPCGGVLFLEMLQRPVGCDRKARCVHQPADDVQVVTRIWTGSSGRMLPGCASCRGQNCVPDASSRRARRCSMFTISPRMPDVHDLLQFLEIPVYRRTWQTATIRGNRSCCARISSQCFHDVAMGFSRRMSYPSSRPRIAAGWCSRSGMVMRMASANFGIARAFS